jgi:phosphatidate cytidylyltransferase
MLQQRVITAVLLGIALVVIVLWMPKNVALGVFALIVLMGAWEWSAFPRYRALFERYVYVLGIAAAMAFVWESTRKGGQAFEWFLWITAAWWVVAFLWVSFAPAAHNRFTAALCGLFVLVPCWVSLAHMYMSKPQGPQRLLFLLALAWSADIGAFFIGRSFGRLKLAPRVSPSKTWEGVLGGLALSAIVAVIGAAWFQKPREAFIALCLAAVLASIVGDLTESMFKRYAGLKDSGSVFPGHGGVLDRIDSVTAAAPIFLLGVHWMDSVP